MPGEVIGACEIIGIDMRAAWGNQVALLNVAYKTNQKAMGNSRFLFANKKHPMFTIVSKHIIVRIYVLYHACLYIDCMASSCMVNVTSYYNNYYYS